MNATFSHADAQSIKVSHLVKKKKKLKNGDTSEIQHIRLFLLLLIDDFTSHMCALSHTWNC